MAIETLLQNFSTIYTEGQPVRVIGIIESGSILMKHKYFSLTLNAGQVMGLLHLSDCVALTTDTSIEASTISAYRLENKFPDNSILLNDPKLQRASLETVKCQLGNLTRIYLQYKDQLKTTVQLYDTLTKKYTLLCEKLHITPKTFDLKTDGKIVQLLTETPYQLAYYSDLNQILEQHSESLLSENKAFVLGILLKAAQDTVFFKTGIENICDSLIQYRNVFFS